MLQRGGSTTNQLAFGTTDRSDSWRIEILEIREICRSKMEDLNRKTVVSPSNIYGFDMGFTSFIHVNSIESHEFPWKFHEIPWNPMKSLWNPYEIPWFSMNFHDFPWFSMNFPGLSGSIFPSTPRRPDALGLQECDSPSEVRSRSDGAVAKASEFQGAQGAVDGIWVIVISNISGYYYPDY